MFLGRKACRTVVLTVTGVTALTVMLVRLLLAVVTGLTVVTGLFLRVVSWVSILFEFPNLSPYLRGGKVLL